jgi:hypothetical protein
MDITAIITTALSVLSAIMVAWFGYNQTAHNREVEAKIEENKKRADAEREKEIIKRDREYSRRRRNSAVVYGEIGELRTEFDACRVYIAQPHPMGDIENISIYYEVKRKGVEDMRKHIQQLPLADIPTFSKRLSEEDWMHYTSLCEVKDEVADSLMHVAGTKQLFVVRLLDINDDWCGSLFLEYTRKTKPNVALIKKHMEEAAKNIHLILPEYKE